MLLNLQIHPLTLLVYVSPGVTRHSTLTIKLRRLLTRLFSHNDVSVVTSSTIAELLEKGAFFLTLNQARAY